MAENQIENESSEINFHFVVNSTQIQYTLVGEKKATRQ